MYEPAGSDRMWVERARGVGFLALALLAGACATAQQEVYEGAVEPPPSMEVLPEPDVAMKKLSKRMRFGLRLARESFEVQAPLPPANPTVPELERWADRELQRWLERKNKRVEAAREELDAAAKEAHRQRIMAGALVGLMYEDVARVLLNVPVPDELRSEPDIAQMYREVIDYQAKPYLQHARRAYRACAQNAVQPSSMHHWSRFCSGRRRALPRVGDQGMKGGTEVTVEVAP